jgi:hypothetical protein
LNRRRYRVVEWAAMDFLREAITRSRRILEIRDLLLLALRMLCLLLFGVALARPFLAGSASEAVRPDQPVHAVLLVDNSMSMGYEKQEGTLLDEAKAKVKDFVAQLPPGSYITVLPTSGAAGTFTAVPYASPTEALTALGRIQVVDRATRPAATIDLARDACGRLKTLPKQIVFFTDQQVAGWPAGAMGDVLPSQLQIIQVGSDTLENAWVADLKLRDGMADTQSPGVFVAKVGYQGPAPRLGVQVTLTVDGATVAAQTVDLQPGQLREVQFPPYRFEVSAEPGKPTYVIAQASIPADRLPADDQRFLAVPVVTSLPVVFVDQFGAEEDPHKGQYGETFWVRRLLSPLTSRNSQERQLVQIRHLKISQLTREALADARLVVIAGIRDPGEAVPLLQQYVEQGGKLLLAAGGDFDPAQWTQAAWLDGAGILPAPLDPSAIGQLPSEATTELSAFVLDFDTLVHQYFWPEGASEQELRDSLAAPCLFFKAVAADTSDKVKEQAAHAIGQRVKASREALREIDEKLAKLDQRPGGSRPADAGQQASADQARAELDQRRSALSPNWLLWQSDPGDQQEPLDKVAERAKPAVLGRYQENHLPFIVRRQLGRGQVLLLTTSLSPSWTTLPKEQASAWLFDHILRGLLSETFPTRNLETDEQLVLPVPAADRTGRFTLVDSEGQERALTVDALGGDRYGVKLSDWTKRGVYRMVAGGGASGDDSRQGRRWEVPLTVNGPADESELVPSKEAEARWQGGHTGFLDSAHTAMPALAELQSQDLWSWAILATLALLLIEIAILALSDRGGKPTA